LSIAGTATEMYLYGSQYIFAVISLALCGLAMHYIIIPVFHGLQITSTYEVTTDNAQGTKNLKDNATVNPFDEIRNFPPFIVLLFLRSISSDASISD
jgi:hypothetical protein